MNLQVQMRHPIPLSSLASQSFTGRYEGFVEGREIGLNPHSLMYLFVSDFYLVVSSRTFSGG